MRKTIIAIFILVLSGCSFCVRAQETNYGGITKERNSISLPEFIDDINVGANLGFSIPSMRYSGEMYHVYDKSPLFSGMGGLFADWNFYDNFSLRPYLNFTGRGVRMQYGTYYIDYKLKATYFDLRIPVVYTFNINSKFKPYVALGPSLNFVAGGKATYFSGLQGRDNYKLRLNNSNFKRFDFTIYAGAGVSYPVTFYGFPLSVGAEIGYNMGMVNTFAKAEINKEAVSINIPEYKIAGTRKNHNLSISVNVSIPLKCLFRNKKKSKVQQFQPSVSSVTPKVEKRKVTVREKQCCSLEEMYEYILGGQDISTKKICAFDDINFDFDKATIRPSSKGYLDMFVTILKKIPTMHISIIGHTDNVGDSHYNMQLSKRRAEAVAEYFIANGIDASRLRCFGHGSRMPLTDNSNSDARAINRRVEFDIEEGTF